MKTTGGHLVLALNLILLAVPLAGCLSPSSQRKSALPSPLAAPSLSGKVSITAHDAEGRESPELARAVEVRMEGDTLTISHRGGKGSFLYLTLSYDPERLSPREVLLADRFMGREDLVKFAKRYRPGKVAIAIAKLRPSESEPMELGGPVATIRFAEGPDQVKEISAGANFPGEPMVVVNPDDLQSPQDGLLTFSAVLKVEIRIRGDNNADGEVGFAELTRFLEVFGLNVGDPAPVTGVVMPSDDFDGSGSIDYNDINLLNSSIWNIN